MHYNSLLLTICIISLVVGCKSETTGPVVTKSTVAEAPKGPSKVELSDAKVTFEPPKLVKFQINYKFTEGGPYRSYLCEITFPNTTNIGRKYIESWELKESGTLRDGIELQSLEPMPKTFELKFSEAEVPQDGYTLISNVLGGEIQ